MASNEQKQSAETTTNEIPLNESLRSSAPIIKKEGSNVDDKDKKKVRYFEYWPGNNIFYFKGRLVSGPDKQQFYTAIGLLVVPEGLFCGVVCPELFDRLTPAVLAFSLYIFCSCLVFLFVAALMDPGIIPRKKLRKVENDNPFSLPPMTKKVKVGESTIDVKYCESCSQYRPPRAVHCATCNNCVDRFDHHCPYLGNCVGKRNYRVFLLFIFSVQLNCVYVATFCLIHLIFIVKDNDNQINFIVKNWRGIVSLLLLMYTVLAFVIMCLLTSLHCKLIYKGETTNENIKKTFTETNKNPFSRGPLKNFLNLWFPPSYESYVPFDEEVADARALQLLKEHVEASAQENDSIWYKKLGKNKNSQK